MENSKVWMKTKVQKSYRKEEINSGLKCYIVYLVLSLGGFGGQGLLVPLCDMGTLGVCVSV